MDPKGWRKVVDEWNPVVKAYLHSDTRAAAEDMAFMPVQALEISSRLAVLPSIHLLG